MTDLPSSVPNELQVEVMSPISNLYEGPAQAVSSKNPKGKFDILPGHAHFISLIEGAVVVHIKKDLKKKFDLEHGVIRCYENQVKVYVGL